MGAETLTNGHHSPGGAPALNHHIPKAWLVQKYGGTSVGRYPERIAEDIVRPAIKNHRVAVVCSARSRSSKTEGTTNRLLRAAREAEKPRYGAYEDIVRTIEGDHIAAANDYIKSWQIAAELCADIRRECQDLVAFLAAVHKIGEISPRSLDSIISKGENLSCRFMAALLNDRGIEAQFVDLSGAVNIQVSPNGLDQDFYEKLGKMFAEEVYKCGTKVPVLTGYFGMIPGGLLKQIGRGYSDLCAALVSVGLQASELQVWKEVDGIFTADPRKVPTAWLLPEISPAEAAELTFYGSEVIHPFTMEQVIRARIPIRIKNVTNPRGSGTVIAPDTSSSQVTSPGHRTKLFRNRSASLLAHGQRPKRPTAITIKHNILVLNVHSNKRTLSHGFFAKIFSTLDKWRLSVDLISTSEVHVSMALHSESALVSEGGEDEKKIVDKDLQDAISELEQIGTVDWDDGMAILSLVGKQMKHMTNFAGKMFSTLGENDVNIEMISQGASEINISCVIEERDAVRAINILHTEFFTFGIRDERW